jgi:hypothetical protein
MACHGGARQLSTTARSSWRRAVINGFSPPYLAADDDRYGAEEGGSKRAADRG